MLYTTFLKRSVYKEKGCLLFSGIYYYPERDYLQSKGCSVLQITILRETTYKVKGV